MLTEKCYAATVDCRLVATRFFGVQASKTEICPIGVDTDLFFPARSEQDRAERAAMRARFGFEEGDIVCVYSGRFTEENPLVLARAVEVLRGEGLPFKGIFVGNGLQEERIRACSGCSVHPFVPFSQLASYFRAAEIGVWPTQESMSLLDAAACGLPVVANHTLQARERIDGNGLLYQLNDVPDLVRVLKTLISVEARRELGDRGAKKMAEQFSWLAIARRRLSDYRNALHASETT